MKLEKQINWFKKHWFKPKRANPVEKPKGRMETKIDKVKTKRALRENLAKIIK